MPFPYPSWETSRRCHQVPVATSDQLITRNAGPSVSKILFIQQETEYSAENKDSMIHSLCMITYETCPGPCRYSPHEDEFLLVFKYLWRLRCRLRKWTASPGKILGDTAVRWLHVSMINRFTIAVTIVLQRKMEARSVLFSQRGKEGEIRADTVCL